MENNPEMMKKAVEQNRRLAGLPPQQSDMSVGAAIQLLKDKGYTVAEICTALIELNKREKTQPRDRDNA